MPASPLLPESPPPNKSESAFKNRANHDGSGIGSLGTVGVYLGGGALDSLGIFLGTYLCPGLNRRGLKRKATGFLPHSKTSKPSGSIKLTGSFKTYP